MRAHHPATVGRLRPRRDAGRDPRRDAQLRRQRGRPACAQTGTLPTAISRSRSIAQMAELGVFGLTLPEEYGGMGLGKEVHVRRLRGAVARLYRRRLARHALGDRGRAHSRRRHRGAEAKWLPKIASGEMLPTAVFTEPNTGSDLASLKTRAVREGDVYKVYGNKTWITHPVRADLMTLLVRTNPNEPGYHGLSMLLAEKPRGDDDESVPGAGHVGQRDRGARLSRHEGVRDRLRRLRSEGREPARRGRGPGLQAADADLRGGAHPDRGARHRRRRRRRWS